MYKVIFIRNIEYSISQTLIVKEKDLVKTISILISNNYVIRSIRLNESENEHE